MTYNKSENNLKRTVKYAYNAALRYLGFRSRSRKEIEDYLKSFEDNTIRVVMEKLERYGLADSICQDWVRNRMHTGARSRVAIAYELHRKGSMEKLLMRQ